MNKIIVRCLELLLTPLLVGCGLSGILLGHAAALSGSDFQAGHIIDDVIFTNSSAMSAQDIQNFLNAKMPSCDTNGAISKTYLYNSSTGEVNVNGQTVTTTRAVYGQRFANFWNNHTSDSVGHVRSSTYMTNESVAPYVCLKSYVENPTTHANNLQNPGASISGGQSAAQLILSAAQQYQINPEVLLVTLQKEQGLVSDDWPWMNEYEIAMGYACPDTAPCNSQYFGFSNQVNNAAAQFRRYLTNPNGYNYVVGNNTIAYDVGCSGSTVNIQSQSTAALYDYTPYQPDSTVLSNTNPVGSSAGPGSAPNDNCATYGNRNFWWYFNTWFGSTLVTYNVWYDWQKLSVDSTGDQVTVPVRLTQQPSSPVQVTFGLSDTTHAQITANQSLFFNQSNWNNSALHTITIKGLGGSDSSTGFNLQVSQVISDDGRYSQQPPQYYSQQRLFWSNTSENLVYRLYNSSTHKHAYTASVTQKNSLVSAGYSIEGTPIAQCPATSETPLMVSNDGSVVGSPNDQTIQELSRSTQYTFSPGLLISNKYGQVSAYLMRNASNDSLITTNADEVNAAKSSGYNMVAPFLGCEPTNYPVYRLYNPANKKHFYSTGSTERDYAISQGFSYEGSGFYLGGTLVVNVLRAFNNSTGDHFYTTNNAELNYSLQLGYSNEGIAFPLGGSNNADVFRALNKATGDHFYTVSSSELTYATQHGYTSEGVVFSTP